MGKFFYFARYCFFCGLSFELASSRVVRGGDSVTKEKGRFWFWYHYCWWGGLFLKIFGVVCRNRTSMDFKNVVGKIWCFWVRLIHRRSSNRERLNLLVTSMVEEIRMASCICWILCVWGWSEDVRRRQLVSVAQCETHQSSDGEISFFKKCYLFIYTTFTNHMLLLHFVCFCSRIYLLYFLDSKIYLLLLIIKALPQSENYEFILSLARLKFHFINNLVHLTRTCSSGSFFIFFIW